MKVAFLLFSLLALSACTVYTVTNKSQEDVYIETTNKEKQVIKASQCIELTEYFLGLAGDFPLVLKGEEEEKNPGHYEITEVKSEPETTAGAGQPVKQAFKIALSEKNPDCTTKDNQEENKVKGKGKGKGNQEEKDQKVAKWVEDQNKRAFCLSGQPNCQKGVVKCIIEGGSGATPACMEGGNKTESQVTCPPQGVFANKALCLRPVQVTVVGTSSPTCGAGVSPTCSEGGKVVCGYIPEDNQNKAYCVSAENIRWNGSVTCSNGAQPSCS